MLDVRPEAQYDLFHIRGAQNIQVDELSVYSKELIAESLPNRIVIVMSNDETAATEAWKILGANVYILEGGINNRIAVFGQDEDRIRPLASSADEVLRYTFPAALGNRYECANPSPLREWELGFAPKIQLQLKRDKSGGGYG